MDPKRRNLALLFVVVTALIKLALVSEETTVAQSLDATAYARMTVDSVWAGADDRVFLYRPGTGLVAGMFRQLGLPYRLAVEVSWILACLVLATGIARVCQRWVPSLAVFALLLFHPWSFWSFRELMSEPLFGTGLVVLVGGVLHMAAARKLGLGKLLPWGVAIGLALWDTFRVETYLLVATYSLWVFGVYIHRNGGKWRGGELMALLIPLLAVPVVEGTVSALNKQRNGVYAMSAREGKGYTALMRALHSVDAEDATAYAPVTRASLEVVIDACSELQPYREQLLDPAAQAVRYGQRELGRDGEFGARVGLLFLQQLRGEFATHGELDVFFGRVAEQVREALSTGSLPMRDAPMQWPLNPEVDLWTKKLVSATSQNVEYLLTHPIWSHEDDGTYASSGRLAQFEPVPDPWLFDKAAQRRTLSTEGTVVVVRGLVVTDGPAAIDSATLETSSKRILAAGNPDFGRVEVLPSETLATFGFGPGAKVGRLELRCSVEDYEVRPTKLGLWRRGVRLGTFWLQQASEGVVSSQVDDGETVAAFVSTLAGSDSKPWRREMKRWITTWWVGALYVVGVAFALASFLGGGALRGAGLLFWIALVALLGRLGFYSVLVAMTGWVWYPRYVQVAQPMLVLLFCAFLSLIGAMLTSRRKVGDSGAVEEVDLAELDAVGNEVSEAGLASVGAGTPS